MGGTLGRVGGQGRLPRHYSLRMIYEKNQRVEFFPRERQVLGTQGGGAIRKIDPEIAHLNHIFR
jgi:hypothetical protein